MKQKDKLSSMFPKLKRTKKSKLKSFDTALISLGVHQQEDPSKNATACVVENKT